jgi:hypothetical protein
MRTTAARLVTTSTCSMGSGGLGFPTGFSQQVVPMMRSKVLVPWPPPPAPLSSSSQSRLAE